MKEQMNLHLITINKFDFVLQTTEINPFHTSKFGWIDCLLRRPNGIQN